MSALTVLIVTRAARGTVTLNSIPSLRPNQVPNWANEPPRFSTSMVRELSVL